MTWRHVLPPLAMLAVLGCSPRVQPLPGGVQRFVAIDDGTVLDNARGVAWVRNIRSLQRDVPFGGYTWPEALAAVAAMNAGARANYGYTNWRLPHARELMSLRGAFVVPGNALWCWRAIGTADCSGKVAVAPFVGLEDGAYWSGSSAVAAGADQMISSTYAPSVDDPHSADAAPMALAVDAWGRAVSLPKTERRRLIVLRNLAP